MIIKRLRIKNFGPFRGTVVFDLLPTDGGARSIVLVGGDNGMGKTTILAAIKLCLYGKRCTELWPVGQGAYRQFIARKFNNPAFASGDREVALELDLLVWENRIEHELTVKRSYQLTDSRLFMSEHQESLEVFRDGKPLEVPSSDSSDGDVGNQYDELLRILIPSNFAQFYFFDGERVRDIFERTSAENVSQAVRDLLNLTVFERVTEDLKKYRQFKLPTIYGRHQVKLADLRQRQAEHDGIQAQIDLLESQLAEVKEQLAELEATIQTKEKEFVQLGGLQQTELDQLKERERTVNSEYDRLTKQLKEAVADQISVCFLLPMRGQLEERLAREKNRSEWLLKRETIEPHIGVLADRMFGEAAPQPTPPLLVEQSSFLRDRLGEEIKKLFWPPPINATAELWFDLRDHEVADIQNQLSEAAYFSAGSLKDIAEAKNRVFTERQRIQEKLNSAGDTLFTQRITQDIKDLHEQKGTLLASASEKSAAIEHEKKRLSEIATHKSHFFNSIIVGVFDTVPEWIQFDLSGALKKIGLRSDGEIENSLGVLVFDGSEKMFAIDGQHRVEGIKIAFKEYPETIKHDQYSIVFVAHVDDREGKIRTRRLFSDINKRAVPVSNGDKVIIDEDDLNALVARRVFASYPHFARGKLISLTEKERLDEDDVDHFTNLLTLYSVNKKLRKLYRKVKRTRDFDSANVEGFEKMVHEFYDFAIAHVSSYRDFFVKHRTSLKVQRKGNRNILFRPIGLTMLAKLYVQFYKQQQLDLLAANINRIEFESPNGHFDNILWTSGKIEAKAENQTAAFHLCLHLLGQLPPNERPTLRDRLRIITKNSAYELPPSLSLRNSTIFSCGSLNLRAAASS